MASSVVPTSRMIDHVGFSVADYALAKAFYERALAPLGYTLIMKATAEQTGQPAAGFGSDGKPDLWIGGEETRKASARRLRSER